MSGRYTFAPRGILIALGFGVGIAVAVALVLLNGGQSHAARQTAAGKPRSRGPARVLVHTDHATFPTLSNLVAAAELVAIGTVTSSAAAPPITTSEPGAPEIPQTDYGVETVKVIKGPLSAGTPVTVDVATASPEVYVEGGPTLNIGQTYLFFLVSGGDGKYYALAGDTAIAPLSEGGTFTLPSATTGGESLTFTESDLSVGPPDHVAISFKHGESVAGDAQSGGVSVSSSAISGTAIVQGRQVEFDLTITHHNAVGSFAIDGVVYGTTPGGLPRFGEGTTASLHGPVRADGATQVVDIAISGH